jgi:tRNA A-37 threonylcarbamoyl transferase component Bud32
LTPLPFEGLDIIQKFPSRKNTVYLVERNGRRLVLKLYDNGRRMNEAEALRAARKANIAVPDIVDEADDALLMEFIPGKSVNDHLGTADMEEKVLGVAAWLAEYHRAFRSGDRVRIKSDAIFKNFIVSDRIYGIDFELSRMGRPGEDVGEALAYLLDTYPMFTDDKFILGRKFIERYENISGIVLAGIEADVGRALREAARFRPAQRELLIKKAGEVEASPFILSRR